MIFTDFQKDLYDITWEECENQETAAWLLSRLRDLDVEVTEEAKPMDHGVWVPLKTAWPAPEFPVYQLSLNLRQGLQSQWTLGQNLQPLRDEGVLIIGSGGMTHNLRTLEWHASAGYVTPWAQIFVDAVDEAIARNDRDMLCQPWNFPYGNECHPTIEYYAPLVFALGTANGETVKILHHDWMYGSFALNAYGAGL